MLSALRHIRLLTDAVHSAGSVWAPFRARTCRRPWPPRLRYRARRCSGSSACSRAGSAPIETPGALPLPMQERPAMHATAAAELAAWRAAALDEAKRAAAGWREPDDPSFSDLQRELRWLLEDAVESQQPLPFGSDIADAPAKLRLPLSELRELWRRRLQSREPLQYLTGAAHWRGLVLAVGPGALIPRPETEQLLDFALKALRQEPALANGPWADLGTGSGALAVGLAAAARLIDQVWAVDSSPDACAWASHNARRLAVADIVQVRQGSWLEPLQPLQGRLAGILSNPPYIEREVLPSLQAEVRLHEPASALDGGAATGMDCLRHIAVQAALFLRPGGFLALETGGPHQTQPVAELLAGDFQSVERRRDLYGVERFVTAIRD